jgi:hypothetical protein
MRKLGLFLISVLLLVPAGGAWAQDKPAEPPGTGTEPAPAPDEGVVLYPEQVVITVDGRTVDAAPPGVAVRVTVTLRNGGREAARDVRAHLAETYGGEVSDADATYGDIAAEGTAKGAFTVTAQKDGCQDYLAAVMNISYDGGSTASKFAVPVACPGPRLAIERVDFDGGDGDDIPEPGETVRAFVYIRNNGRDPARDVTAKVTVTGKGITSASDDLAWPDIAAGELERSSTAIEFSIPKDAPRQEGCSGTPAIEIPPEEGGTARDLPATADDTPVSSDGSTVSSDDGNVSSGGGSSPGSAGSGEPTVVEPDPGSSEPGGPEPAPEPGTVEPEPGGTVVPVPLPAPGTPEPAPSPTDQPAYIEMHLAARADGYSEGVDYSNGLFCAVAEGGAASKGAPDAAPLAARDTAFLGKTLPLTTQHNAGVDIGIAAVVAIAAVAVRRYVLR